MSYRILVAEDNYINQKLMEKLIQSKGWECKLVGDGSEVVKELKSSSYDMVLMDISMPDMDGYTATHLIREFDTKIPVIGITANALTGFREKCIDSGMNDYISKPFRKEELFEMINRYLAAGK
jgi:two-component system, sensor histidine kinase